MSSRRIAVRLLLLSIYCGALSAQSQTVHTHIQLSEGTSGHIIVINGSPKTIEAFHMKSKCGTGGGDTTKDKLESRGTVSSWAAPDGTRFNEPDVIGPWARVALIHMAPKQPGNGCVWDIDVDAVIYADGTFEGDESVVRTLQAQRDGYAAALAYWTERFKQDASGTVDVEATAAAANRMVEDDSNKGYRGCLGKPSPTCAYWRGRWQVDINLAERIKPSSNPPSQRYDEMVQECAQWRAKIEADNALKTLDAVFPLPSGIAPTGMASLDTKSVAAP